MSRDARAKRVRERERERERESKRETEREKDREGERESHFGSGHLAQVHCTLNLSQMAPSVAMVQGHASCPACVASCWWGGSCPNLRRRCCLFRHSPEEVGAALSVERDGGGEMERNVFELAAEVQELRFVVQRLAGAIMWDRGTVHVPQAAEPHSVEENFG